MCVSKNGHQKEVCSREIGQHAQTMPTILGSIVNINWDRSIWSLNEHNNLHFDNEKDIHVSSENLRGKWLRAWFGFANQFALIACFISYEKWAQGESVWITQVYVTPMTNFSKVQKVLSSITCSLDPITTIRKEHLKNFVQVHTWRRSRQ